ncbi:hypothetical protein B9Z39_00805 [Limnohabitans sp. JirII-29]|uniref:autotransporter outer membrane beta-barrel domain-containing protein n=1 Tax=Limnohabitans sp. JirII-29 TaxID=1835756 RepID=UPI000D34273D|nr:autotransporter-associated beta strand repeat-containing protein [Limnohabitans sp. JirII-29]PUE30104.1 hypothetical protein B9Z39_00805 [Limnohabitans sp. JirII-29]
MIGLQLFLRKMKSTFSKILLGSLAFSLASGPFAHTTSIGYTVQGTDTVNIWYGSYHTGTTFNEGSLTLVGINGNSYASNTVPFSFVSQSLPNGLVSGVNYFGTTGGSGALNATLIGFDQSYYALTQNLPQTVFQGAQFSSLGVGTYQFTYQPLGAPSANWAPINNSILTSQFTLGAGGSISVPGVTAPTSSVPDIDTQAAQYTVQQINNSQVNPRFTGGTLQIASGGTITTNFTITNSNGTIDQNGNSTTIAGRISDDSSSDHGKMIITNSGTAGSGKIVLSATNTNSGGYEVNAGAILEIASASALGTGTLALVGSSTVPATLSVTADTTISNAITVSGDPVFNIASGTTTTISSSITDGAQSGDVVVQGGGTLLLTAANTYTGPTTVDQGSTLALSSSGSIAASSSVTNNGTFDVTGKTGNIGLKNYSQSSTGTLVMSFSPTNNQRINIDGSASLGGGLSLAASSGSYALGRYTLITANSGVSGTFSSFNSSSLAGYTSYLYSLSYDANNVYLDLKLDSPDTQSALLQSAAALRSVYNMQAATINNSLNYDCTVFAENKLCVSAGGRYATTNNITGEQTSTLLVAAYKVKDNLRLGTFIDQNAPTINATGITLEKSPVYGVFGVWNENSDAMGYQVRLSTSYANQNIRQTRNVVATSEAGTGTASLTSQAISGVVSYAMPLSDSSWIASPYFGVRKTKINRSGYTETNAVTTPLTYSDLTQNITTALVGVRTSKKYGDDLHVSASVGVEQNIDSSISNLNATGITGLTATDFSANYAKTRPVASVGASYAIAKDQRISLTAMYRKEAFQSAGSTTALFMYQVGL